MSARSRSGVLIVGLILIFVGAIFLAESFYASFSAWQVVARYWPLIPILIGLKKLFDFFTWQEVLPSPDTVSPKQKVKAHRRRPSLLGALLWIGIGVLFLVGNFGAGIDLWSLTARYWPVLLILLGLGRVLDYLLKKDMLSVRIGELFGLFFLLFIGFAVTGVQRSNVAQVIRDLPIRIGETQIQPGQWFGESHTYSEEATYPLGRSLPIQILNSYGSVTVAPGSDREVRVRLKKTVYGTESQAKGIADKIRLVAGSERSGALPAPAKPEAEPGKAGTEYFTLRTNREDLGSERFSTEMEVFIPKNSQLQVQNTFGSIRVTEINGKINLSAVQRSLEVRDCTGEFTLSTRFAECRLTNLKGNVNLDGRGRIYLESITGDVTLTNEYSPTEILGVEGRVSITSTEGSVRIEKVSKPVVITARGTRVKALNLKDSVKINATHGTIDISGVDSDVKLESRYAILMLKSIKNVDIDSNGDRISAEDIQDFTLKGNASRLRLNGIRQSADIQATLTDIVVSGLEGNCSITSTYANVSVSAQELRKLIRVKNQNGRIDLFLPRDGSFGLTATAVNGRIRADYPGLGPVQSEGRGAVLKSTVGAGGPAIELENLYGDIRISHGSDRRRRPGGEAEATVDNTGFVESSSPRL